MSNLSDRLTTSLTSRADRQILRSLTPIPISSPLVDFSSNDYLSLSRSPLLRQKVLTTLNESTSKIYGPPSSRLLDGNTTDHLQLEDELASFFRGEQGLLFNSGFDANVSVWTTLPAADDYIIYDELIHASTHDGMRASRVEKRNRRSFRHNDLHDLKRVIERVKREVGESKRSIWVTTESLFSMDGDLAPIKGMVDLVAQLLPNGNGHWIIDEAHSTGLYGENGRGVICALGLEDRITVRVHTFGKAMACTGAVVIATPLIRSYLINYARPLIYSTVMPYMNVVAISKSLEMLRQGHGDIAANHVHTLSALFHSLLSSFLTPASSLSLPPSLISSSRLTTTPIIPLLTSSPRPLSAFLIKKGFLVRPISYPTVPKGEERVRVCLHGCNTEEEVRALVECLKEWCGAAGSGSKL